MDHEELEMKRRLAVVLLAVSFAPVVAGADAGETPNQRLASMSWLEGHWIGSSGKGSWEAIYSGPEGGSVLSLNKEIVDGELVTIEFEQFVVEDDAVVMIPAPGGRRSEVRFTLTDYDPSARRAVFTNPEHDFPQTIVYERRDDDTLTIDVRARRGGETVGFTLELARVVD
jgi:hypothetical protein